MKRKTLHALLLSLVMVAGAMTINDAFAQTNTERLITVIDTTADTNVKVSGLVDLWADFDSHFTPIINTIDDISGDLSIVSDKLSMVSDDTMSVNSKVSALESKVDTLVAANADHAEDSKMNLDSLVQTLPEIEDTVDQIAEDTNASLSAVSEMLDDLENQIGQFTSTIQTLQSDVEEIKNEVGPLQSSIQDRIGPALVDLQSGKITQDIPLSWYTQGLTSVPSNGKYSANFIFVCESDVFVQKASTTLGDKAATSFESSVNVLSYKNPYPDQPDNISNNDNDPINSTSLINGLIRPDNVDTTQKIVNPIYSDFINTGGGATAPYENTVLKVDFHTLFASQFEVGDKIVIFNRDANFNLMGLKAGNPLQFTSTVHDPRTDGDFNPKSRSERLGPVPNWRALEFIANTEKNTQFAAYLYNAVLHNATNVSSPNDSLLTKNFVTKAQLKAAKAYDVTVEYLSVVMDPKCKITPSETAELDNTDKVTFASYEAPPTGSLIQEYTMTLDCDLNPAKITNIIGYVTGASGLNNYVNMELKVGNENKGKFTFKDNVSVIKDEESLPIEFHGADLTISGKTVSGSTLLVEIRYDTIANNECKEQ